MRCSTSTSEPIRYLPDRKVYLHTRIAMSSMQEGVAMRNSALFLPRLLVVQLAWDRTITPGLVPETDTAIQTERRVITAETDLHLAEKPIPHERTKIEERHLRHLMQDRHLIGVKIETGLEMLYLLRPTAIIYRHAQQACRQGQTFRHVVHHHQIDVWTEIEIVVAVAEVEVVATWIRTYLPTHLLTRTTDRLREIESETGSEIPTIEVAEAAVGERTLIEILMLLHLGIGIGMLIVRQPVTVISTEIETVVTAEPEAEVQSELLGESEFRRGIATWMVIDVEPRMQCACRAPTKAQVAKCGILQPTGLSFSATRSKRSASLSAVAAVESCNAPARSTIINASSGFGCPHPCSFLRNRCRRCCACLLSMSPYRAAMLISPVLTLDIIG